jgi:rubrerythrin
MGDGRRSGARWVGLTQALVARELVESLGVSTRHAAELLGLAPSAVSQYLGGKRREVLLDQFGDRPKVRAIAYRTAVVLAQSTPPAVPSPRLVLEAAAQVAEEVRGAASKEGARALQRGIDRVALGRLRQRVAAEQSAVSECMQLAQKAGDELTRSVFRQIASDSLRHAEIVASLAGYLETGVTRSFASGVTRADVQRLIRREREAERGASKEIRSHVGGVMALLLESMEADERKHEQLLQGLVKMGFAV